jgi:hypothetical protein
MFFVHKGCGVRWAVCWGQGAGCRVLGAGGRVQGAGGRVQGNALNVSFFNHEPHEKAWRGLPPTTHFLTTKRHEKTRKFFIGVVALPEGIAPAKFLCAKVGFTFSVGGDMERRRLAGMKPVFLSHH